MRTAKDDKLKALLKQAGTDKPAESFTDSVMQLIEADAARELALKTILKQQPAEGPSFDFTASVMRQVSAQRKPLVIQPIITKKAWYAIFSVVALMLLVTVILPNAKNPDAGNSRISSLLNQIQLIPATYVLAAVAIAALLLGDYLFTQRNRSALNQYR